MKFPRLWGRAPATAPETRANPIGAALVMHGGAEWSRPANRRAYIDEGYRLNVVVYRCVREVATAISDMVLEVHNAAGPIEGHPALALLKRPNPMQAWDAFIENVITDRLILGECAVVAPPGRRQPVELWPVCPLDIEVKPGRGGVPLSYVHKLNGKETVFPVDQITGQGDLWFNRAYDPANYWRGMSPLVAAGLVADTHNAGVKWNYKLLRNSARPSGLLQIAAGSGGEIVAQVKEWFARTMQGADNAGKPLIAEGEAKWTQMDATSRDMDFLNTQKEAAKLIAAAFGVPLPLIDNDASSYNNMETAKERFYTDTVIPLARSILSSFGAWLLPRYGEGLEFEIDLDKIVALEGARARMFDRMVKAVEKGIITVNEAREAIGYKPAKDVSADMLDPTAGVMNAAPDPDPDAGDEADAAEEEQALPPQKAARLAYGR